MTIKELELIWKCVDYFGKTHLCYLGGIGLIKGRIEENASNSIYTVFLNNNWGANTYYNQYVNLIDAKTALKQKILQDIIATSKEFDLDLTSEMDQTFNKQKEK